MQMMMDSISSASFTSCINVEWVKVVGAVVVFGIGLYQYRKAQRWKRHEFIAAQMKDFADDKRVQAALTMLDWNDRVIALPSDITDKPVAVIVREPMLCAALLPGSPVGFTVKEALIRDSFDRFLDGLVRFWNFAEAKLINIDELRPYMDYWLKTLSGETKWHRPDFYTLLHNYIRIYEFVGVAELVKRFGYNATATEQEVAAAIQRVRAGRSIGEGPTMPGKSSKVPADPGRLIDPGDCARNVPAAIIPSGIAPAPGLVSTLADQNIPTGQHISDAFAVPAPPPNADTDASDQDRVTALWNITEVVTADFDVGGTPDNTRRFMMYIAWHESARLQFRIQQLGGGATGPARSFFQIQGASAQTAYNSSSMTDDRLNTLASVTGSGHDAIVAGFEALTASPSFPAGNLIATLLEQSDIFGAYVARALLWTFPAALPTSPVPPVALFQPEADYWFQYWHGGVGDADTLKQQFRDDCATIDPLLPAVAVE